MERLIGGASFSDFRPNRVPVVPKKKWCRVVRSHSLAPGSLSVFVVLLGTACSPSTARTADANGSSAEATRIDRAVGVLEDAVRRDEGKPPATRAAELLRFLGYRDASLRELEKGKRETPTSELAPEEQRRLRDESVRVLLVPASETPHAAEIRRRREAARTMGDLALPEDMPLLMSLLDDPDEEVRIEAAAGVLRIGRRRTRAMGLVDWSVLAGYAALMLAIGWYYSYLSKTREDYLLGGRGMNAWTVGLSLFAGLLSTISFLAVPGEVIKNGPMIFCMVAAYPIVYVLVGYWIIPKIMRLRVTSAYEILETRFGIAVRVVGSSMFLLLRLLWMAVIVFATAKNVLVPILGLEDSAVPWICLIMGFVTVIYTAMGGLKAVVSTGALQTFILFLGAFLTFVYVNHAMGGLSGWWIREWPANWETPVWGFAASGRMTFLNVLLATLVWHICTEGSDQMTIQRFLATRDARSARGVLGSMFVADVIVTAFLVLVGVALFSFFRANPEFLPDGKNLYQDADKLLPRYVVIGLPAGVSGLVVAGLLAAAMSSLSSGINSTSSVVIVDFIERLSNPAKRGDFDQVVAAKRISAVLGVAVVLLSTAIGLVTGNLIELAYKVVNLLTAPLFGLFFMALFVRRATAFGTLAGGVAGLATVVLINYWEDFFATSGLGFMWAMPVGIVVQVVVGIVFSLLGGTPRPMLAECDDPHDAKVNEGADIGPAP